MEQENKHNEFNKHFHDAFADWETPPPAGVWDKVEAGLEQEGKKRPVAWWWFSGAVLLLLGLGAWYFWPAISDQKPAPPQNSSVSTNSIESHKADSVKAIVPKTTTISDSTNAILSNSNKTDSSTSQPVVNRATSNSQSQTTSSTPIVANTSPVNTHYTESYSITHKPKPTNAQITKANYIRTDSLLSALPPPTSTKINIVSNNTPPVAAKKDSVKTATTNTTQTPVVTTEESITSTSQSTPAVKKKDSIASKKDSTIEQKQAPPVIAKTDSTTQQKKADSLLANKKTTKDSLKKDSLVKNTPKDSNSKSFGYYPCSISGFFSPEIAKIDVTANNSKFNAQNVSPQNKYSLGLKFGYSLSKRVQLSIGLSYSEFQQNFSRDTVSFPKAISQPFVFNSALGNMSVPAATMLSSFSPLYPGSRYLTHYQYNQTIQFINVPISARFNFLTGKLKPYATVGMNVQYTFSQHAELDLLKELETDVITYNNLEVRTLNFAASVGLGAEYDFSKHLGAYIEPNARFNLLSNSTNSTVYSTNSFMGCQVGITYLF